MPRLAAGAHTFVYRQITSTGVDINPELRIPFIVRAGDPGLAFWPADPVALEPVDVTMDDDTCYEIMPPTFVDGGMTLVRQYFTANYLHCDGISTRRITLGAFPPGEYSITVIDRAMSIQRSWLSRLQPLRSFVRTTKRWTTTRSFQAQTSKP